MRLPLPVRKLSETAGKSTLAMAFFGGRSPVLKRPKADKAAAEAISRVLK
jgi:hypothetical protein